MTPYTQIERSSQHPIRTGTERSFDRVAPACPKGAAPITRRFVRHDINEIRLLMIDRGCFVIECRPMIQKYQGLMVFGYEGYACLSSGCSETSFFH